MLVHADHRTQMQGIPVIMGMILVDFLRVFLVAVALVESVFLCFRVKVLLGLGTFLVLAVVMSLVTVAGVHLHTFHMGLLQQVHTVHHPQKFPLRLDGGENGVHPGVAFAAQIDEQVAVLHRQNVGGGGLIGVALHPRRQQHFHIGPIACHGTGKVVGRKHGDHNAWPVVTRLRGDGVLRAAAEKQGNAQYIQ